MNQVGGKLLMKASLKLALSTGLMATMILPGFLPVLAENKTSAASAEPGPFAEIDARLQRNEHRIVDDLATGRLTPQEAEDLKGALDRIVELEVQFRQNKSSQTKWQELRLHTLLDKLADQIDRNEHDRDTASADLQFTRESLAERINQASQHNRLTPQEVSDLKQRFNKIFAMEVDLTKSNGGSLSYLDKLALCIDYDHLGQRLSKQLSERPLGLPDTAAEAGKIEKRIDEGAAAGKISDAKKQEFKQKLSELRATGETYRKASAPMSNEQLIALGLELESLANKVEAMHAQEAQRDSAERLKQIDSRLGAALQSGSLNPMETLELKEDYDSIIAARDKFASGGQLKQEDELALKLDIARLEGRIERQLHNPSRVWPGLVVALVHVSHRNKQGFLAKRISADDSKQFGKDLTELNKKLIEYDKAEGGIKAAQALQIAEELQNFEARLDKALKDRQMELPNIEGLKQAIDGRIGDAAVEGKLSVGDARTAVLSMGRLNSVKEKYSASDSELNPREKFAIAFELERLATSLEEQMHGHELFFPGLDNRRSQIEALINEGVSSGRLSASTAENYRNKLAQNTKQERQFRSDSIGLTGDKAIDLVNELEGIWLDLDRELREKAVRTSDLVSLEGNVEKKIRRGFSDGVLSPVEAQAQRKYYDDVVNAFNTMRSKEGGLSYGERLAFAYGFQRLAAQVERNLRSVPINLPLMERDRENMEQRLGNLLSTGRMSAKDAQELKGQLDAIANSAAEKRSSGGGVSFLECLIVAVDMDRMNKRIEQRAAALKSPLPNIDALQSELNKKLEEAKVKKAISAAQYKEFKTEMDRIAANEAAFRISDESLNYAEAINLVTAIQQLKDRLQAPKNVSGGKPTSSSNSGGASKSTSSTKKK